MKIQVKNKTMLMDKDDLHILSGFYRKLQISSDGYVLLNGYDIITKKRSIKALHRLVVKADPGQIVDHINGNKLDNRKRNLRLATRSQNACNSFKPPKSRSGFRGVKFAPEANRRRAWIAAITLNRKYVYLGLFPTARSAAKAYDEAARKIHGEFARTNKDLGLL